MENYRGISPLSVIGKRQERIVYIAIYNQVISFVHDSHPGFLTGRSCTTQLLLVHHDWFKVLDKSGQVDVVFIDFSKAFDLVCHDIFLAKLYKYGVHDVFGRRESAVSVILAREAREPHTPVGV